MKLPFKFSFKKPKLEFPFIKTIFTLVRRITIQNEYIIQQNERIIEIMSANQDHINALSAQLDKVSEEIKAEVQSLKDAAANGETLDFSALDSKVQGLDDLNTDAVAPAPEGEGQPEAGTDGTQPEA